MTGSEFSGPPEEVVRAESAGSPFTYERVDDPAQADFSYRRAPAIKIVGRDSMKTDEEILARVKEDAEKSYWFLDNYWKEKGVPHEQIELAVGDQKITIFNFNPDTPFTEERLEELEDALGKMSEHFPQAVEKHRYILVDNVQTRSSVEEDSDHLQNGHSDHQRSAFVLLPQGMSLAPHRIAAASNLAGTITHEMAHPITGEFSEEWGEHFQWAIANMNSEWGKANAISKEWEWRATKSGQMRWFNTQNGKMLPQDRIPLQPEQCVTKYAEQSPDEDICDSIVAYIYDRDLLAGKSSTKLEILERHDAKRGPVVVTSERVAADQVALPVLEHRTIRYYIQEPTAA